MAARKVTVRKSGKRKGKRNSPTSKRTMAVVKKRAEAVELRLQGWQFNQIGEAIGVSTPRAYQLVQEGLDDILMEPVEKLRAVEIARCDAMLTGVFPAATQGDHAAIQSVMTIAARRDRLLGLDTPQRVQVEGAVQHQHSGAVQHTMEIVFVEAKHEEPEPVKTIDITPAPISNGHDIGG